MSRFRVVPIEGAAGFLNMELTEGQAADLFGALGIPDDNIALLNMQGTTGTYVTPTAERKRSLGPGDMGVEASALDPFAGSYKGDENDNEEVGRFLDSIDEIKAQAGISDLLLSSHFGRSHEERSRGATVWKTGRTSGGRMSLNGTRTTVAMTTRRGRCSVRLAEIDFGGSEGVSVNWDPNKHRLSLKGEGGGIPRSESNKEQKA